MKIVCISDTHCQLHKINVPEGDLLIHTGDLTFSGNVKEISQELRKLGEIAKNFKHGCILIAGNHDRLAEHNSVFMENACKDNGLIYLKHSSTKIEHLNIFGSPYTPAFGNWVFMVDRAELFNYWASIPEDTNILITHGPPTTILDGVKRYCNQTNQFEHVGCFDLYNRIQELKNLKLHVFGHIHEGYGKVEINGVTFVNASISTREYKPINKPVVIEI